MAWRRVVVASEIASYLRDQSHCFTQQRGRLQPFFFSVGTQGSQFDVREQHLSGQFRGFSSQKCHQHNPPGNDKVNGDRAAQTFSAMVSDILNAAPGLEHAMQVFDTPAQTVPAQASLGIFGGSDIDRGQQEPLHGLGVGRRIFLLSMNDPNINRLLIFVVGCWRKLNAPVAHRQIRRAPGSLGASLLFSLLRSGALARDMNANPTVHRFLTNGREELEGLLGYIAVILGPYQQIDARVLALLVEQLKEVRLPVAHLDQSRMRHLGRQFNQIAVMFDPGESVLLFDRNLEGGPAPLGAIYLGALCTGHAAPLKEVH